jgi:uncharacterized membrane protein YjdF
MFRNLLFVLVILLAASPLPTAAQVNLEMNKITCADWLGYDQNSKEFVRYWMSGYYSASKNNNVLDFRRLKANSDKVLAYCKKNKSATLPAAIQKTAR